MVWRRSPCAPATEPAAKAGNRLNRNIGWICSPAQSAPAGEQGAAPANWPGIRSRIAARPPLQEWRSHTLENCCKYLPAWGNSYIEGLA